MTPCKLVIDNILDARQKINLTPTGIGVLLYSVRLNIRLIILINDSNEVLKLELKEKKPLNFGAYQVYFVLSLQLPPMSKVKCCALFVYTYKS